VAALVGETPGTGAGFDSLCGTCYWKYQRGLRTPRRKCQVCGRDVLGEKTYVIHTDHRPFLPPESKGATFFCQWCYDKARQKGPGISGKSSSLTDESDCFPAQENGLGEEPLGADGEMGCGKEPQKVAATDLSAMMQALTNHRFDGHPISDVDGYQKHVDSVAHGLFSLFLSAVPNQTAGTKEKVAMILELFGHIVDPAYSQMAWELTTVLHSSGVSDRQLRGLSSKGLVMCTSKLHEHENLMQERHERRLNQLCSDSEKRLMLVTDDFHQIESAHGLPRKKNGKFSVAHHVANAILKEQGENGLDIAVEQYPECLTPRVFSAEDVENWIQQHWSGSCTKFYFPTRLKFLEEIAATLQPYSTNKEDVAWDNPISMQNVTLLRCFDNPFKDRADVEAVFSSCSTTLAPYLSRRHMVATGDWYTFSILLRLVHTDPAKYGRFLPIPGAFHIGLNAQQGIFCTTSRSFRGFGRPFFQKRSCRPNRVPSNANTHCSWHARGGKNVGLIASSWWQMWTKQVLRQFC